MSVIRIKKMSNGKIQNYWMIDKELNKENLTFITRDDTFYFFRYMNVKEDTKGRRGLRTIY